MKVVVVGATGNIGTSLLAHLEQDRAVTQVVGISRRRPSEPDAGSGKTRYVAADITSDELVPHLRGADAVVDLAWAIQPSHDLELLYRVNVEGTRRLFAAVVEAGVPSLVYASSVGAYSPGPKDRTVDESWPTGGITSSFYSRHKAAVERLLDDLERDHPQLRVVRVRPSLTFKHGGAAGVGRLFLGRLLPKQLLRRSLIPVVPDLKGLRIQVTHSLDMGQAFHLAVTSDARGAFNIAADPILDPALLGAILGARPVPMPVPVARGAAWLTWQLHLQPTPPGWLDMALRTPLMDSTRAREQLGWSPQRTPREAILDVLEGIRTSAALDTPPLAAHVPVSADPNVRLGGWNARQEAG